MYVFNDTERWSKSVCVCVCVCVSPGPGPSLGSPEGLGVLLEAGQVLLPGLRVGVFPHRETRLEAAHT